MVRVFTNGEIIELYELIEKNTIGQQDYVPVIYNFYIQKNFNIIRKLAKEILDLRNGIIQRYGVPSEENPNEISISPENVNKINEELENLENIKQEVTIMELSLLQLAQLDCDLSTDNLQAIMFMIDDDANDARKVFKMLTENEKTGKMDLATGEHTEVV
jgi:hypothetical protein